MIDYNFTIIIPHYNIPRLLKRCVDSIPKREDTQIIIIDDCSPNSQEVQFALKEIASRSNVEIFHTLKGGSAGRARNIGLDNAKGKWLIFADSDDFFDAKFDDFLDSYNDCKADVVYFNFRSVLNNNISQASERGKNYSDIFIKYNQTHNDKELRFLYTTPWGKMVKLSLVKKHNLRFDETRYANDAMFIVLVGCKASSICICNNPIYVLTERSGSLASDFCNKPHEVAVRTWVALRIHKTIADHGFNFNTEYEMFIRILVWNGKFKTLLYFYHNIDKYRLKKKKILDIVHNMPSKKRHLFCIALKIGDMVLCLFKK